MMDYLVAGLRVRSELPLRHQVRMEPSGEPDVVIRQGAGGDMPDNPTFANDVLVAGAQDFLFRPRKDLSLRVRRGREITISRSREISDHVIDLFVSGSALGVLLHQRGLLPLHCSSVLRDGRIFAFTGPQGAGKSTLAASLSGHGFTHVSDDVLVANPALDVTPVNKGLKLAPDAIEALGLETGPPVLDDPEPYKFYVDCPVAPATSARLAALYVLAESDEVAIHRLRGSDLFSQLHSAVYRVEWLNFMRDPADVFRQVAALAQSLPVYRFERPRDLSRLQETAGALADHVNSRVQP